MMNSVENDTSVESIHLINLTYGSSRPKVDSYPCRRTKLGVHANAVIHAPVDKVAWMVRQEAN